MKAQGEPRRRNVQALLPHQIVNRIPVANKFRLAAVARTRRFGSDQALGALQGNIDALDRV